MKQLHKQLIFNNKITTRNKTKRNVGVQLEFHVKEWFVQRRVKEFLKEIFLMLDIKHCSSSTSGGSLLSRAWFPRTLYKFLKVFLTVGEGVSWICLGPFSRVADGSDWIGFHRNKLWQLFLWRSNILLWL